MSNKLNFTYENIGAKNFLVYNLDISDEVDTVTSGMLLNNKIEGLIPYTFSQLDTSRSFKYNITSKVTLNNYLTGNVTRKRLVGVLQSITNAILEAEEYLIDINSFIFDPEYIYVDVSSYSGYLVCLPLMNMSTEKVSFDEFIKEIMYSVQFDQSENCDYVAKIISFLNSRRPLSIPDFKRLLGGLMVVGSGSKPSEQKQNQATAFPPNAMPNVASNMTLNEGSNMAPNIGPNATPNIVPGKPVIEPRKQNMDKPVKTETNKQQSGFNMGFDMPELPGKKTAGSPNQDDKKESKKGSFLNSIFGSKKKPKQERPVQVPENNKNVTGQVVMPPINKNTAGPEIPQRPITNDVPRREFPAENKEIPQRENKDMLFDNDDMSPLERTIVLNPDDLRQNREPVFPYLVRKRTNEKININKEIFKIGT
ncbi:MAG TPA: DUF6382 domain-containing protein, partial [Acetivibrio sp.]|nr:DUF6382 domain-containing protein [Acetivibrio sp.]